ASAVMALIGDSPNPLTALGFQLNRGRFITDKPPVWIIRSLPGHSDLPGFTGRVLSWKHGVVCVIAGATTKQERRHDHQEQRFSESRKQSHYIRPFLISSIHYRCSGSRIRGLLIRMVELKTKPINGSTNHQHLQHRRRNGQPLYLHGYLVSYARVEGLLSEHNENAPIGNVTSGENKLAPLLMHYFYFGTHRCAIVLSAITSRHSRNSCDVQCFYSVRSITPFSHKYAKGDIDSIAFSNENGCRYEMPVILNCGNVFTSTVYKGKHLCV